MAGNYLVENQGTLQGATEGVRMSGSGNHAFTFIGTAAFSSTAGQLHYVQNASAAIIQGDTNGDGKADFSIQLTGQHTLFASDFIL